MKRNRYTSEEEILAEMESQQARARQLPLDARRMEENSQRLQAVVESGDGSPEVYQAMTRLRDRAIKARKLARHILENRIPRLGRKLAIFKTELLPGCGEDKSIPVC